MPNHPTPWPVARRSYFSPMVLTEDFVSRRETIRPAPSGQLQLVNGIEKPITYKRAITLAAACKTNLDAIEQQRRGVRLPSCQVELRVNRRPDNRNRRSFFLYGNPADLELLAA